ncbi:MAG: STAS domain-containing protein [Umezawaea sp.]
MEYPEFAVAERRYAGCAVVVVRGEVDVDTAPDVWVVARQAVDTDPLSLIIDCTGVTFFGSTGISLLLELRGMCREHGLPFRLVADSRAVLRPLEVTDLLREFVILQDIAAAC